MKDEYNYESNNTPVVVVWTLGASIGVCALYWVVEGVQWLIS